MALLKVAVMGHPVLRKVAEPVSPKEIATPAFQQFLADMAETMFEYDGRGLAAPQVHVSKQVLVMLWDFDKDVEPYLVYLINPKIELLTENQSAYWEGCLSVPGLRGKVSRPNRISVEALDERGEKVKFVAEGFAATVVQHECDHLWGKLYVDRIEDMTQFAFNKEFARYLANADEPAEEEGEG
jgi:peptide deformylase